MSDIMRPVPFEGLLARIFGEYKASRSIFDISENRFDGHVSESPGRTQRRTRRL
jgi:putative selenate reductase